MTQTVQREGPSKPQTSRAMLDSRSEASRLRALNCVGSTVTLVHHKRAVEIAAPPRSRRISDEDRCFLAVMQSCEATIAKRAEGDAVGGRRTLASERPQETHPHPPHNQTPNTPPAPKGQGTKFEPTCGSRRPLVCGWWGRSVRTWLVVGGCR